MQGLSHVLARQRMPGGHNSVSSGPPILRCSAPWGMYLLRETDPNHAYVRNESAISGLTSDSLSVFVDWVNLGAYHPRGPMAVEPAQLESAQLEPAQLVNAIGMQYHLCLRRAGVVIMQ